MAIVTKSRPEIDMENAIGQYEFSSVARSLFAADGTLLPCNDKYKLMEELEKSAINDEKVEPLVGGQRTVMIYN